MLNFTYYIIDEILHDVGLVEAYLIFFFYNSKKLKLNTLCNLLRDNLRPTESRLRSIRSNIDHGLVDIVCLCPFLITSFKPMNSHGRQYSKLPRGNGGKKYR